MGSIVFIIPDLKGNGAEKIIITLAKGLANLGNDTLIICFQEKFEFATDNLKIKIFPQKFFRWIPRKWRGILVAPVLDFFIKITAGKLPDLVISSLLPSDRLMSHSRLKNVHLLLQSTMSRDMGSKNTLNETRLYSKKSVICCSDGVLNDFLEIHPSRRKYAKQIYNPIDIEEIQALSKNLIDLELPEKYIVHVGKFKSEKRHDILLKAFAASGTHRKLVLVGQGPMESQIKELAEELNIESKVFFAGFHANPFPIIKQADLLVLSSDYEGLPTVLLEALAIGTPCISTDCNSGPREILEQHQLAPVGDISTLSKMISLEDYSKFKTELKDVFTLKYCLDQYKKLF